MIASRHGLRKEIRLVLAVVVTSVAIGVLPPGTAAGSNGVLVVGDSLEVGTGPHLRRELASTPLTIDARTSRPSSAGLDVLASKLRPAHRVVVFDLGVNDDPSRPAALERNLAAVRKMVGDRCLVVATLSRPPLNGVTIDGMNRAITSFVAATPKAQLFDWRAATQRDPRLLGRDRLHPAGAGYASRARQLAGVIEACLDPAAPADRDGEDVAGPRDPKPEARAAPRRGPSSQAPAWLALLRGLPYRSLVTIVQSAIDRVEGAARELAGAVSPQPPEPTLGTPPGTGSGRHARGKRRSAPRAQARAVIGGGPACRSRCDLGAGQRGEIRCSGCTSGRPRVRASCSGRGRRTGSGSRSAGARCTCSRRSGCGSARPGRRAGGGTCGRPARPSCRWRSWCR